MKKDLDPNWEYLSDTPGEYNHAIENAVSDKEKEFFIRLRHKVLHHPAASNDVLMDDTDNEEGLYILRVSDDFMIGKYHQDNPDVQYPREFGGLFLFLKQDLYPYLGYHITIHEWLRKRNYSGINYNADNDLN